MAQSFNCRPLTAVVRVRSQSSPRRIVVDRVALEQVYLRVLGFSLVSIISSMLLIHFHINNTFVRRTSGPSIGTLKKIIVLRKTENVGQKFSFAFVFEVLSTTPCKN
jgi:hypothetical protein